MAGRGTRNDSIMIFQFVRIKNQKVSNASLIQRPHGSQTKPSRTQLQPCSDGYSEGHITQRKSTLLTGRTGPATSDLAAHLSFST